MNPAIYLAIILALISASPDSSIAGEPAPALVSLETTLTANNLEFRERRISPEQYQEFKRAFRADLAAAQAGVPQNPTNTGLIGGNSCLKTRAVRSRWRSAACRPIRAKFKST